MEWITHSSEQTIELGFQFAKTLKEGSILCIFGDLGSGKTTFIKGIVQSLIGVHPEEVTSPTFMYLHSYLKDEKKIHHFDLYRLKDAREFLEKGFDEYLIGEDICCIEWSERIVSLLPRHSLQLHFETLCEKSRKISVFQQ